MADNNNVVIEMLPELNNDNNNTTKEEKEAVSSIPLEEEDVESDDSVSAEDLESGNGSTTFNSKVAPVELTWNEVGVTMSMGRKKPQKVLLKDVSGFVKPGEMLALMGPSGAGKTTMLNVLAQRAPGSQKVSGEVRVNGSRVERRSFKAFSGFVTQEDVMQPFLTVEETIKFYARLRLPAKMSNKEKDQKVEEVITLLGLAKCRNTRIGNSIVRGISGGEKKRVNIAIEILSNPSVLFLDEPTSGLDAFTALNLVKLLRRMAKETGMTMVCTIHQPRIAIFNLFDHLLLLGQGETVYFGPTKSAVPYFTRAGFPIPEYSNPADFFLDIITPDNTSPSKAKKRQQQVNDLIAYHQANPEVTISRKNSKDSSEVHADSHSDMKLKRRESKALMNSMKIPKKAGWFTQFWHILMRSWVNQSRDLQFVAIRIFSSIFMATIVGFTWFQLGNSQTDVYDRNGFIFFGILSGCFPEMTAVINSFPAEREVFLHDRASGVYKVSSYLMAQFVAGLPLHFIVPGLFVIESYWLVGLNASVHDFFVFFFAVIVMGLVTSSMGRWLSATTKDANGANAASTVLMIIFMVFGGFFITPDSIPDYFIWIHYISPVKYGFNTALLSQYESTDSIKCAGDKNNGTMAACQFLTGKDVIKSVGADETEIWQNFLILLGMMSTFLLFTYAGLRWLNKRR